MKSTHAKDRYRVMKPREIPTLVRDRDPRKGRWFTVGKGRRVAALVFTTVRIVNRMIAGLNATRPRRRGLAKGRA